MKQSEIQEFVNKIGPRSGRIHLSARQYDLHETIRVDQPCVCLEGEVWAYSSDPNGVFESRYGTQLRLRGRSFPALSVGVTRTAEGCVIRDRRIRYYAPADYRPGSELDTLIRRIILRTAANELLEQQHISCWQDAEE